MFNIHRRRRKTEAVSVRGPQGKSVRMGKVQKRAGHRDIDISGVGISLDEANL